MLSILRKRREGQRGFVMLLYSLMMLFVIIPMVGLAIDAGVLYTVKAKLQAAVDGAALGAARSLNRGQDIPSQQTAASDTATRYYHANFPNNWMGVTPVNDPTITWPVSPNPATAIINVQGNVNAPTWFMKILGFNTVHLTAIGEATRRNVDIMVVLDRSSSLQLAGNCPGLISGAQLFVNSFSNNRDIIGLLTFGTYYNVDFPPVTDFQDSAHSGANSLATHVIPQLVCAGFTNGAAGLSQAYSTLKALNDHGALNVILYFTDGAPNTITFGPDYGNGSGPKIPLKTTSSCYPSPVGGLSGVIAGSPATNSGGVFRATYQGAGSGYPVASGGDFSTSFTIQQGEHGHKSGSNCAFNTNTANFTNDVLSIPNTDAFGNSTTTSWSATSGFPYAVTVTNLTNSQNIENAGINALDNAAQNARIDANANSIPFMIYSIGLGSVNDTLLARVANDATATPHQNNYPTGLYVNAPDTAHLAAAFATIADDIMRISK